MEAANNDWQDTWRLKAIAASVGAELEQKLGESRFYTPEQVLAACDARQVIGDSRACALGMFVEPEHLRDILPEFGIREPAEEWRRILARRISYSEIPGSDSCTFDFQATDGGGHGFDGGSSSFGDSGADGGGSGGE